MCNASFYQFAVRCNLHEKAMGNMKKNEGGYLRLVFTWTKTRICLGVRRWSIAHRIASVLFLLRLTATTVRLWSCDGITIAVYQIRFLCFWNQIVVCCLISVLLEVVVQCGCSRHCHPDHRFVLMKERIQSLSLSLPKSILHENILFL